MPDAIKALAKAAVTALLKSDPSAIAIAGGAEAVNWLIDRFSGKETTAYDRLIGTVTTELERLPTHEFGGPKTKTAALGNATALFEAQGLSASDLVELNLEPERATQELLRRGAAMLATAGEPVAELVRRQIVPAIYRGLLQDPQHVDTLKPAIFQSLLAQRDAIGRLEGDLGRALQLMTGWWLVTDPRRRWPPRRHDAAVLRAEYQVVDFHAERQPELEALQAWCANDQPVGVQLITGPGGTGKTRLAIQLLGALGPNWRAGFLHRRAEEVTPFALDGVFADPRPLLLVVDYAETRRPVVERILGHLRSQGAPNKVRVLLLARAAVDWWQALQTGDGEVRDLLAEHTPAELPLTRIADSPELRVHVFGQALADYARVVGTEPPDLAGIDLGAGHFATTLFLHIAALAALEGAVPQGEQALLDWALDRERALWLERQDDDPARASAFAQAAALLTLAGGAADGESALDTFRRWPRLKAKGDDALFGMFDLLGELYPQDDGATGVRPDLLGEHLVDQELSRMPALLGAALAGPPEAPLTVLTRLAKRRPAAQRWLEQAFAQDLQRLAEPAMQIAIETGDPLGPVLANELEQRTEAGDFLDYDQLQRLESAIPEQTVALREVGAATMAQMRAVLGRIPQPWAKEAKVEAARVSNNLANRLSVLGRREAALEAAEEAANLYRELARARPDAFTPYLAGSLNNLANVLSELGRREAALEAAEEAANLYRELARARPDAFTPDLAMSLNTLAPMLSELGRREAALQAAEEAVALRRELARARPDAFTPYLAMSLNNLANVQSDLGRREAALQAAEEAANLYRELVRARPDAFTPDLAMSLNNLANRLSELGRREAALEAAEEASNLYRELARARPDAFTPDLAMSLNTLAPMLSELGRREAALQAAEEAVRLYRELARARPDAFTPYLAMSLNNLANRLSELGRWEAALRAAEEAIRTLRPPFLALPVAHASWMRAIVWNYVQHCQNVGREPDAELLGPIAKAFQQMQEDRGPGK